VERGYQLSNERYVNGYRHGVSNFDRGSNFTSRDKDFEYSNGGDEPTLESDSFHDGYVEDPQFDDVVEDQIRVIMRTRKISRDAAIDFILEERIHNDKRASLQLREYENSVIQNGMQQEIPAIDSENSDDEGSESENQIAELMAKGYTREQAKASLTLASTRPHPSHLQQQQQQQLNLQ
jgi:hypothetical protein